MFKVLLEKSHLSRLFGEQNENRVTHHRTVLLLILVFCVQQLGIFEVFANALSPMEKYIYVKTNSIIDDSWIGTRVFSTGSTVWGGQYVDTKNNLTINKGVIKKPSSINTRNIPDSSWILVPRKAGSSLKTSEVSLFGNSFSIPQTSANRFLYAPYTTPSGISLYDIPFTVNSTPSSSSFSLTNTSNIGISGLGTFGSVSASSALIQNLTLSNGTGISTELLGRDMLGKINSIALGSGLTLIGGILNTSTITGGLISSNILSFSGNLFSSTINGFTSSLSFFSDNITEGTNLYFTNLRAQNALSGTVSGLQTQIDTLSGSLITLTNTVNSLSGSLATLSGTVSLNTANITTLSGNLATTNANLATATGQIATLSGVISGLSTNLSTLSGSLATLTTTVNSLSGQTSLNTANITTLSGSLATLSTTVNTISGSVATLSGTVSTLLTSLATTNANLATATGNIATLQTNLNTATGQITTLNINVASITGQLLIINTNIATATGNIATLSGSLATLSGQIATLQSQAHAAVTLGTSNGLSLSGQQLSLLLASTTTTGALSATDWNTFNNKITLSSLLTGFSASSGTLSSSDSLLSGLQKLQGTKIGLTSLSANGPLTYNNLTGNFGISQANTSTNGFLSSIDWNTFNNKLSTALLSLNGLTATGQTFAIGTTGTDFGIVSAGSTHTFNLPDASSTARGFVNTGTQIFVGAKTFATAPVLSGFTQGSILFAGASGILSQNNAKFFWDDANSSFGIGTNTPSARLHLQDNNITTSNLATLSASSLTSGYALQIIGSGARNLLRVAQEGNDPLDIERVTIGQGGISASKPDSLARDQLYVFGRINSSWDHYIADFLGNGVNRTTTDGTTEEGLIWDALGATPTWSASNVVGLSGTRRIALAATANAGAFVGNYNITESNLNPVYESRSIVNTSNATTRVVIGFTDRAQNATSLATDTNNSTNEIFFRKIAASTTWETVTRSTANATEVVTSTAVPVNQWNIFRIEVENSARIARFYINGNLVATHTGTTIPASGIRFGHQIGMLVTTTVANTLDIDYIRVWSDDPPASTAQTDNTPGTATYISDLFPQKDTSTEILPVEYTTARNLLETLDKGISQIATGSGQSWDAIQSGDTLSPYESLGISFLRFMKNVFERFSEIMLDMVLSVKSIITESITTKETLTEKLCVGTKESSTCISKEQLDSILLLIQNGTTTSPSTPSGLHTSQPPTDTSSTETAALSQTGSENSDTGTSAPEDLPSPSEVEEISGLNPDSTAEIITPLPIE